MTQPFIWCDNCGVQPLVEDKMYGSSADGNGYINPTDLMCGKCHLVIATTWDASFSAALDAEPKEKS